MVQQSEVLLAVTMKVVLTTCYFTQVRTNLLPQFIPHIAKSSALKKEAVIQKSLHVYHST
jgi:hypothetical protein